MRKRWGMTRIRPIDELRPGISGSVRSERRRGARQLASSDPAIDGFAWSSRSGENRSVSANGLRRKTQLSRNQSLISHLVSVLRPRPGFLCEISSFIFYPTLLFSEHVYSLADEREKERGKNDRAFASRYCVKTRLRANRQKVRSIDVLIFHLTTWLRIRCDHARAASNDERRRFVLSPIIRVRLRNVTILHFSPATIFHVSLYRSFSFIFDDMSSSSIHRPRLLCKHRRVNRRLACTIKLRGQ